MNKTDIIPAHGKGGAPMSTDRIVRIAQMADAMQRAAGGIVMLAMQIGDELSEQKASMPHGTFLPWLRECIGSLGIRSVRTAQEYMKLSANRAVIEQNMDQIPSLNAAFGVLGRKISAPSAPALPQASPPHLYDHGKDRPVNPRSRRAFAMQHIPPDIRISPNQLARILEWYESDQLATEYRSANGSTASPKARKPKARVSAVVRPQAKRKLERAARLHDMTQGELIEQLLAFADQVKAGQRTDADRKGAARPNRPRKSP
jgi:hypothetical protein